MDQSDLNPVFSESVQAVADRFGTDADTGLSRRQVQRRRDTYGPNRLRRHKKKTALTILAHQFNSIIVWLLAAAAGLSFFLGDIAEGVAIVVVLFLNAAIGFFTELRAARSMEALFRIAEIRSRVRRGGRVQGVDAYELVPGDVVILEAGDVVTADLRLAEVSNLQADESVLTGESTPVTKGTEAVAANAVIGDRTSMAFKGTAITQGAGLGIVVGTGMQTELGRISDLAHSAESEVAPLEWRLDRLGHRLVWLTLALAVLTIGAGILRGHEVAVMVQTGVALAVAAVPEGLPVVATFSLARGMWRMARRNALITRLSSVETLGATTIILTDKTGTLTENRMTVVRYLLAGGDTKVDDGAFGAGGHALSPDGDGDGDDRLGAALRIGALCNNAELGDGTKDGSSGDPMEIALLSVARAGQQSRAGLLGKYPEARKHAFDPDLKMMATVHADGDRFCYAVKGAPEAVIETCNRVLTAEGPRDLNKADRTQWHDRATVAAQDGLRLLGLALKTAQGSDDDPYDGLTLVGLVCLLDPVRADVPKAARAARAAGVRIVMLTGDHADTARTIARNAGLGDGDLTVIEGQDLLDLDLQTASEDEKARIMSADVFARVAPDTKLKLVTLYQQAGHVVAMTGDGVNDAPALKKSDIGIAMGKRGTQVAQEAAQMVLRDDDFATIIAAMRQGRVIFDNIRKFVVYLMSCNVSEVLIVGLAVGIGLPVPLLPLQILFLNLVTDIFPAFALGLGQGEGAVMHKPPRDPAEAIVDRLRWIMIGGLGAAITAATLGAFGMALYWLDLSAARSVTVAFLTLALAQLWNVFNVRDPATSIFDNEILRNPWVWGAISLCLGLIGAALWIPALAQLLGLPNPGFPGLVLAGAFSVAPLIFGQIALILIKRGVFSTNLPDKEPRQGP
jgi:Ca2+-transporting ATPase